MKSFKILSIILISALLNKSQANNLSTLEGLEVLCLRQVELEHEGVLSKREILENKQSCHLITSQNKNEFFAVFNMIKTIEKNEGRDSVLGPNLSYIAKEFDSPPSDSWIKRMPGAGQVTCLRSLYKVGFRDYKWIISTCNDTNELKVIATSFFRECMNDIIVRYPDLPFYPFVRKTCNEGTSHFNGKRLPSLQSIVGVAASEVTQAIIDVPKNRNSSNNSLEE